MRIFQYKFLYFNRKGILFETIILLMILFYFFANLSAQNEPNVKLKVEAGINWKPAEKNRNYWDWAIHLSLEPKLKTSKNTFIGLKILVTENFPNNEVYRSPQFFIDNNIRINFSEANSTNLISVVPTFDYYFSKKKLNLYLGTGIGIYILEPAIKFLKESTSSMVLKTGVDDQLGFLIRGGIDIWKLIIGLEFNYVLEAEIKTQDGLIIGSVDDSFIALSIGYSFGIGKHLANRK